MVEMSSWIMDNLILTYFKRKNHRQVDDVLMTPPRIGPSNRDNENTTEIELIYLANFSDGTSSKNITVHKE